MRWGRIDSAGMNTHLIVFYNQRGPSNPVGGGLDPLVNFLDSQGWLVPEAWKFLERE
jgi:hypothetical protein